MKWYKSGFPLSTPAGGESTPGRRLIKQSWQMLINVEAKGWAHGSSVYYFHFLCGLVWKVTREVFYFLKRMMDESPAVFCLVLQLLLFLESSVSSMMCKSHPFRNAPKHTHTSEVKYRCDDRSPGPFCHPFPISLLQTDLVTPHQANSLPLLSQLYHCCYLFPLF